jgi:cysteine desulfurase
VKPQEVIFTASGSEANSLALFGVCEKWMDTKGSPGHVAVLSIEHHCSLKAIDRLKKFGWNVSLIPVDDEGILRSSSLESILQDDTAIVSVQWANNEVGTIQPIEEVALLCKQRGVFFHTDAVQPIGQLAIPELPDLTSIAAHKFYGPKGMGALIVRDHIEIAPQILGGGQEFDIRAGTENTPGIVGMAKALELAIEHQPDEQTRLTALRDEFIQQLTELPNVTLNGHELKRLPNNVNVRFGGNKGETIVIQLDMQGICAATGSACATGSSEPSHVLEAMGRSKAATSENVRFSLGRSTTKEDLDTVVDTLKNITSQ